MSRARDTFKDYVLEQLQGLKGVSARPMFGGYGIYAEGKFFGAVHKGRVYFRVSEKSKLEYEARNMGPFKPNPKQTLKTLYEVPPEVIESPPQTCDWAREAIRAAR